MPRYKYQCSDSDCGHVVLVFHGINDKFTTEKCIMCEGPHGLQKILTRPVIVHDSLEDEEQEVGELTKEYIESNREILDQQKKEAKEETYEPS